LASGRKSVTLSPSQRHQVCVKSWPSTDTLMTPLYSQRGWGPLGPSVSVMYCGGQLAGALAQLWLAVLPALVESQVGKG
jgi:hypothetical protein